MRGWEAVRVERAMNQSFCLQVACLLLQGPTHALAKKKKKSFEGDRTLCPLCNSPFYSLYSPLGILSIRVLRASTSFLCTASHVFFFFFFSLFVIDR